MSTIARLLSTSIGRKALMALTGLLLLGFLTVHLAGNLLVFRGPAAFNHYSEALIRNPLIYVAELALLALFVAHFVSGILVYRSGSAARPDAYRQSARAGFTSHKSLASTTMILSGLVVLIFVPLHIWTFKYGPYYDWPVEPGVRDLHRLVVEEFREPGLVLWYVFAMTVIGFHLWHGFASAFESLGAADRTGLRRAGHALAVLIALGFALVPLVILATGGRL